MYQGKKRRNIWNKAQNNKTTNYNINTRISNKQQTTNNHKVLFKSHVHSSPMVIPRLPITMVTIMKGKSKAIAKMGGEPIIIVMGKNIRASLLMIKYMVMAGIIF